MRPSKIGYFSHRLAEKRMASCFVPSALPTTHFRMFSTSNQSKRSFLIQARLKRTLALMSAKASGSDGMTYASSGVDIDSEAASVKALITSLRTVRPPRQPGKPGALVEHAGGFSGLIEFGDSLLALCTDGVGSKLLLASELKYYESIAIDCVAMNVNDLLCVGAEPLAFVDYIAAPAPDVATWAALGRSLGIACEQARVSLCGGETASLPDMVTHVDMSGTALGALPRGAQIDGTTVRPSDIVVGLPASGVHSNGYSLVRRVVEVTGVSLHDSPPFDAHHPGRAGSLWQHSDTLDTSQSLTLGEVLLNPTRIYVDPVVDLIKCCRQGTGPCNYDQIHGIVHITGGGLSNLLRLNKDVGFCIDDALPVLPEFEWIREAANASAFEMWRTFNMGMGLCVITDEASAYAVAKWLQGRLPGCRAVGRVTDECGVVRFPAEGVVYDRY